MDAVNKEINRKRNMWFTGDYRFFKSTNVNLRKARTGKLTDN